MVAFEPCLATVGVAGDGSGKYHIYTIPYLYHTELPTFVANQRRKCICHRQTI